MRAGSTSMRPCRAKRARSEGDPSNETWPCGHRRDRGVAPDRVFRPGAACPGPRPAGLRDHPVESNAVTMAYSFNDGTCCFEGTVPITDATGRLNVPYVTYYRSLSFFGRSANVAAALPTEWGPSRARSSASERSIYRSGLFDSVFRFSVNLKGGPAMSLRRVEAVAAEDPAGRQPQGRRAHGPVRPDQAHQPGRQPLGVQAGAGPLATLGPLGARRLRLGVALHGEPRVLLPQRVRSRAPSTRPRTRSGPSRPT